MCALLAVLLIPSTAAAAGRCGSHPWCDTALSPDQRADLLLGEMTQDEKAAFLGGDDVGGVLGREGTHTGTQLGVTRLDLPTIYYSDGPQGPRAGEATAMPGPMALAATFDRGTARAYGTEVGSEVWAKGNDVVFAPTINVMRTPFGGRTFEGYGEDPFLISQTAVQWIRGAQSQGLIADVKHFAVNNQEGIGAAPVGVLGASAVGSRMTVDAQVDERTLREIELAGFEAAVKQGGAGTVMCSYNKVNGQYACEQHHLIQEILEGEWGFQGYVLSDYGSTHNTIASLNNGLDFEPWPGVAYRPELIQAALAAGQVSKETLDGHVRRILRTLFAFGSFDHPTVPYDDSKIDQAAHNALAGRVAEDAATLLRNENGTLPLGPGVKRIALIGADADTFKNRGGSAGITPFSVVTPRAAITERAGPDAQVTYDDGSDTGAAVAHAKDADVAIVFASDSSIEGKDKTCLNLTCPADASAQTVGSALHDQDALIEAVAAATPHTVVVLETGGPVLTPWRDRVAAILEAWDPGQNGGNAIARVLFGDTDPGGRLPVTFPNSVDDLPTAGDPEKYPGVAEQVKYKEKLLVGYRWFDAKNLQPAFPFGFGLSYTSFKISGLKLKAASGPAIGAKVSVRVANTGGRTGTAVPQVYVGMPDSVGEPPKQLKGYRKMSVEAGRSKTATMKLGERAFSHWDTKAGAWTVAKGCYRIMVGSSSREIAERGVVSVHGAKCPGAKAQIPRPPSRACVDTRKFHFKLHHAPGARVVRVVVYVNGKRRLTRRGHDIKRVTLRRLPKKRFVVRVVATQNTGSRLISTRVYHGCKKTRPQTRAHHGRRGR